MKISLRQRFFAWMLKNGDALSHKLYGSYKRKLFGDLYGTVVEIGPGTGVNFQYFPPGISWIGIEPNEAFYQDLKRAGERRGIASKLIKGAALEIPLADNSADALISTLVLCSVKDPPRVLAEIFRVLKPGGKFIFIEHVAAFEGTKLRLAQNIFNPINQIVADGCNCNRETWKPIEELGFKELEMSHHRMKGTLSLHSPHIIGRAIK